ncbi:MAG: hypothetical protein ACRDWT_19705, partial [Jatrophihabitantaceae bacterium]
VPMKAWSRERAELHDASSHDSHMVVAPHCAEALVQAEVGGLLGETDRWRPLIDRFALGLAEDPQWPVLARAFTRAAEAGFDVETRIPDLIAERPLPETYAGRSLDYRLANVCPEAFDLGRTRHAEPTATTPSHHAPQPYYARAFGNPPVNRGGPRR